MAQIIVFTAANEDIGACISHNGLSHAVDYLMRNLSLDFQTSGNLPL